MNYRELSLRVRLPEDKSLQAASAAQTALELRAQCSAADWQMLEVLSLAVLSLAAVDFETRLVLLRVPPGS